jgi:hypothetical protein
VQYEVVICTLCRTPRYGAHALASALRHGDRSPCRTGQARPGLTRPCITTNSYITVVRLPAVDPASNNLKTHLHYQGFSYVVSVVRASARPATWFPVLATHVVFVDVEPPDPSLARVLAVQSHNEAGTQAS